MNTVNKLSLLALPAILLLGSCGKQECGADGGDPVSVRFGSGNIATTRTVAAGEETHWVQDDRIGIFMIDKDASAISGNIKEGADNRQYRADGGGSAQTGFSPVGNVIYYPNNGEKVDFIAYYPYKAPLANYLFPVDVSDQNDPGKIDILYSNNARDYGKGSPAVDLQFIHALSKLEVQVIAGNGSPSLSGLSITIEGRHQKAGLSLSDGLTFTNTQNGDIMMRAVTGADYEAILIPQNGVPGSKAVLRVGSDSYDWDLSGITFEQGKRHRYTITVNKTDISISTGDITDWNDKDTPPTVGGASTWKVGDYYPDPEATTADGGVTWSGTKPIGVVFWVDPSDGRHGKVVSLHDSGGLRWSDNFSVTNATDESNGLKNMNTIKNLSSDFSGYPSFGWVHSQNAGSESYSDENATGVWYIPALSELQALYNAYNSYGKNDFNARLTEATGGSFGNIWYWSSSEGGNEITWCVSFTNGNNNFNYKSSSIRARCILAF